MRIGVSGWRYPSWRGAFYPKGLPQRRELEYIASILNSIELNAPFYSLQRPESYARWRAETPRDFLFAVKGSRYITHILRLRGIETALANFFASGIANLREKLGPFLWQLPPNLEYDAELIDAFLSALPRDTRRAAALARRHGAMVEDRMRIAFGPSRPLRHALEVRNASFAVPEFIALLRRHGVAFVIADTSGKWPDYEDVTAEFLYIRLHGHEKLYRSSYSDAALERWAERIRLWHAGKIPRDARCISREIAPRSARHDVYCYFDNTDRNHAPRNALTLMRMLGLSRAAG